MRSTKCIYWIFFLYQKLTFLTEWSTFRSKNKLPCWMIDWFALKSGGRKGLIRSRISKDKQWSTKHDSEMSNTYNTESDGEFRCSWRKIISCYSSGTHRVTIKRHVVCGIEIIMNTRIQCTYLSKSLINQLIKLIRLTNLVDSSYGVMDNVGHFIILDSIKEYIPEKSL